MPALLPHRSAMYSFLLYYFQSENLGNLFLIETLQSHCCAVRCRVGLGGQFLYYHRNRISKIEIQPFENNVAKREIIAEKPKTEIQPMPKTTSPSDSYALAKLLVITALGILILLLGVR